MSEEFDEALMRKLLFVPCESKEALHTWIKVFLGIDLPDSTVDPASTGSPMDSLWEVYSVAKAGGNPDFSRVMHYAARGAFKTSSASIIEVLSIFHLNRSVAHMAAIKLQSHKAIGYIKDYLHRPLFRDYITLENADKIEIERYENPVTGENITRTQWELLPIIDQLKHKKHSHYIKVVVATMAATNGDHVPFMCVGGSTRLLIKNHRQSAKNRKRLRKTARGIFQDIAGLSKGGNPEKTETFDCEIIEPKRVVEVLTQNMSTGAVEFKPITRAHRNKKKGIRIHCGLDKNIEVTLDHPIYSIDCGFVEAKEIKVGDNLVFLNKSHTNKISRSKDRTVKDIEQSYKESRWEQILIGTLLGDTGIYKKEMNNPYIRSQHCLEQEMYLRYKIQRLSERLRFREVKATSGYTGEKLIGFSSGNSPILLPYINIRITLDLLDKVEPEALAYWYMDDGCKGSGFRLSTECWDEEQNKKISTFLNNRFGFKTEVYSYGRDKKIYYAIRGRVEDKILLSNICKPYIHPSMSYKFDISDNKGVCKFCKNEYFFIHAGSGSITCGSTICLKLQSGELLTQVVSKIEDIEEKYFYDFTIADNNNFFGNGFLNKNCIDEIDVIQDERAYEEAKMIPDSQGGQLPITLLISTRKSLTGLVQRELDKANDSGLVVRHWNILDVTEKCPPKRHKPEEPMVDLYVSDEDLRHVTPEEYELFDPNRKARYHLEKGFAGCTNCPIFSFCKTRLTKQTCESPVLKPINQVIQQFKSLGTDTAIAQLLCRKPSSEGLVFPRFMEEVHTLTAADIAQRITDNEYPESYTKQELITLAISLGCQFYTGIDWGFTHDFAVVSGFVHGSIMYVFDVMAIPGLDPDQKLDACQRIKQWNPDVFADTEDPGMIKMFRRRGKFKMREWDKNKFPVTLGIDVMKIKFNPGGSDPQLFILRHDSCLRLVKDLNRYSYRTDAVGNITEIPSDKNDDVVDAARYLVMNVFAPHGKIKPDGKSIIEKMNSNVEEDPAVDQMRKIINDSVDYTSTQQNGTHTIKKGRFIFDL